MSSAPLPPDCKNYRDALKYHLSKLRPENRQQVSDRAGMVAVLVVPVVPSSSCVCMQACMCVHAFMCFVWFLCALCVCVCVCVFAKCVC